MHPDYALETYWFSFPKDPHLPMGIGVTAYSESDANMLLCVHGIDEWFVGAKEVSVCKGVRIQDLDQGHVVPNIGPMQFRGVWYPCMNVGYGAPVSPDYRPLVRRLEEE